MIKMHIRGTGSRKLKIRLFFPKKDNIIRCISSPVEVNFGNRLSMSVIGIRRVQYTPSFALNFQCFGSKPILLSKKPKRKKGLNTIDATSLNNATTFLV